MVLQCLDKRCTVLTFIVVPVFIVNVTLFNFQKQIKLIYGKFLIILTARIMSSSSSTMASPASIVLGFFRKSGPCEQPRRPIKMNFIRRCNSWVASILPSRSEKSDSTSSVDNEPKGTAGPHCQRHCKLKNDGSVDKCNTIDTTHDASFTGKFNGSSEYQVVDEFNLDKGLCQSKSLTNSVTAIDSFNNDKNYHSYESKIHINCDNNLASTVSRDFSDSIFFCNEACSLSHNHQREIVREHVKYSENSDINKISFKRILRSSSKDLNSVKSNINEDEDPKSTKNILESRRKTIKPHVHRRQSQRMHRSLQCKFNNIQPQVVLDKLSKTQYNEYALHEDKIQPMNKINNKAPILSDENSTHLHFNNCSGIIERKDYMPVAKKKFKKDEILTLFETETKFTNDKSSSVNNLYTTCSNNSNIGASVKDPNSFNGSCTSTSITYFPKDSANSCGADNQDMFTNIISSNNSTSTASHISFTTNSFYTKNSIEFGATSTVQVIKEVPGENSSEAFTPELLNNKLSEIEASIEINRSLYHKIIRSPEIGCGYSSSSCGETSSNGNTPLDSEDETMERKEHNVNMHISKENTPPGEMSQVRKSKRKTARKLKMEKQLSTKKNIMLKLQDGLKVGILTQVTSN